MTVNKRNEKGAVTLVESAMVFPIVFFMMVLIMYLGVVYYVDSYMSEVASQVAIEASEFVKNESIYYITTMQTASTPNGYVPDGKTNMYQQVAGLANKGFSKNIETHITSILKARAGSSANALLGLIKPNITSCTLTVDPGFLSSNVTVKIDYKLHPNSSYNFLLNTATLEHTAYAYASVNDSTELIRNIDFVEDVYIDFTTKTEVGKKFKSAVGDFTSKISSIFSKIGDVVSKFFK